MADAYQSEGPQAVYDEAVQLLQPGILKIDHFEGIDRIHPRVHSGAPNWRSVGDLAVFGSAQPTLEGLKQVVNHYSGNCKKSKVVWINMRTEPVIYVNGFSLAPRNPSNLKENLEINSLTVKDITELENYLVNQVIRKKVAQSSELVYFRDTYSLIPEDRKEERLTEATTPEKVLTLRQAYDWMKEELPVPVDLVRLPINDVPNERVPDLADFDHLVELVRTKVDTQTAVHCNCQMGRGRTTTGMFLVALIYSKQNGRQIPNSPLTDTPENGFYSLVRGLLERLPNGSTFKSEIDALMNSCDQLINLRGFIWHCKEARDKEMAKEQPDETKNRRALFWHNLAKNYVERYFYFICFNAYLTEHEGSFTEWCEKRNDLFVDLLGRNAGSPQDLSQCLLQKFEWN